MSKLPANIGIPFIIQRNGKCFLCDDAMNRRIMLLGIPRKYHNCGKDTFEDGTEHRQVMKRGKSFCEGMVSGNCECWWTKDEIPYAHYFYRWVMMMATSLPTEHKQVVKIFFSSSWCCLPTRCRDNVFNWWQYTKYILFRNQYILISGHLSCRTVSRQRLKQNSFF